MTELPGGGVEPGETLAGGCERRQEQKLDPGEFVTVGEVALGDQPAGRFVPAVGWELPGLAYALD